MLFPKSLHKDLDPISTERRRSPSRVDFGIPTIHRMTPPPGWGAAGAGALRKPPSSARSPHQFVHLGRAARARGSIALRRAVVDVAAAHVAGTGAVEGGTLL